MVMIRVNDLCTLAMSSDFSTAVEITAGFCSDPALLWIKIEPILAMGSVFNDIYFFLSLSFTEAIRRF